MLKVKVIRYPTVHCYTWKKVLSRDQRVRNIGNIVINIDFLENHSAPSIPSKEQLTTNGLLNIKEYTKKS